MGLIIYIWRWGSGNRNSDAVDFASESRGSLKLTGTSGRVLAFSFGLIVSRGVSIGMVVNMNELSVVFLGECKEIGICRGLDP